MSLKGFHIFFISFATLFCLGFAVWALFGNTEGFGPSIKTFGLITGAAGILLMGYGVWFVKMKASKIIV